MKKPAKPTKKVKAKGKGAESDDLKKPKKLVPIKNKEVKKSKNPQDFDDDLDDFDDDLDGMENFDHHHDDDEDDF
jgi:hypothetical protein